MELKGNINNCADACLIHRVICVYLISIDRFEFVYFRAISGVGNILLLLLYVVRRIETWDE